MPGYISDRHLNHEEVMEELVKSVQEVTVKDISMAIEDVQGAITRASVAADLNAGIYGLDNINFEPGDVVVDIGANVGIVSIYLAKRWPEIRVYAYEPVPENFNSLVNNVEANGVKHIVKCRNVAVTSDGRLLQMIAHMGSNTGGATGYLSDMKLPNHQLYTAMSVTPAMVYSLWGFDRCKLLKIDCEGAEYEILRATTWLGKVDYLAGEFHVNKLLASKGYDPADLVDYCAQFVPRENMFIHVQAMAD